MNKQRDPANPSLHVAVKAYYGSGVSRDLNHLTALLRKLAFVTCGLEFLLQCRHNNLFPKFISNAARFACHGYHLSRLVESLPKKMLRAAIRDNRSRLSGIQHSADNCWMRLYNIIRDEALWESVVSQKDAFFFRTFADSTNRLQRKFAGLFAASNCSKIGSVDSSNVLHIATNHSVGIVAKRLESLDLTFASPNPSVSPPNLSVLSPGSNQRSNFGSQTSNSFYSCVSERLAVSDPRCSANTVSDDYLEGSRPERLSDLLSEPLSLASNDSMANSDLLNQAFSDPLQLESLGFHNDSNGSGPLEYQLRVVSHGSPALSRDPLAPIPLPWLPETDVNLKTRPRIQFFKVARFAPIDAGRNLPAST